MPSIGFDLSFSSFSRVAASHSGLLYVCGSSGPTEGRQHFHREREKKDNIKWCVCLKGGGRGGSLGYPDPNMRRKSASGR